MCTMDDQEIASEQTQKEVSTKAMDLMDTSLDNILTCVDNSSSTVIATRLGMGKPALEDQGLAQELNYIIKELEQIEKETAQRPRVSTGFPSLDKILTGLVNGSLVLIAGRPAMGKTSFALELAKNMVKSHEKTIVIFTLELSKEQATQILMRKMGGTNLEDSRIQIRDDILVTVEKMQSICENTEHLGTVIIDYFQLIDDPALWKGRSQDDYYRAESIVSRKVKSMAEKLNVPVIVTSQLTRSIEYRADKRPRLSDLRERGVLEQDSDVVIFLYRDEYYNKNSEDKGVTECIVAKNRFGDCRTAKLQWNLDKYTFLDMPD